MHFFDPTVDWPKDLLDPPVPDLFVVQSKVSLDSNHPWNDSSGSSSWNTPWIEYAALDREERFINMTFFNTRSASKDEKKQISERSDDLDDESRSIGWYKSTLSIVECFATLQKTNAFRCWRRKSLPKEQGSESSVSPMTFRRMKSPSLKQPLDENWDYLLIEPIDESSEMEFTMSAKWEAELEQPAEVVAKDRQPDQSGSQAEMLKLYFVASSKKLDPDQPTGGGPAKEQQAET